MSAPNTNIESQERRHWPSLLGIAISALVGAALGAAIMFAAVTRGNDPAGAGPQIEGDTPASATAE